MEGDIVRHVVCMEYMTYLNFDSKALRESWTWMEE
jgi:hypothetical protein